ncbi:MAG: hypothetical protein J7501_09615 [Bdellovibrio sp.]|nr:hypothetical protein [Bdellovibrio sp.]
MASHQHAIDYVAKKLDELAANQWLFKNLHYQGLVSLPTHKDRVYGFGEVQVLLKPKGELWIEGAYYRNFVSADGYQSAKEAVDQIFKHLSYIDKNHMRLKDDPEDWAPKNMLQRLKSKFAS